EMNTRPVTIRTTASMRFVQIGGAGSKIDINISVLPPRQILSSFSAGLRRVFQEHRSILRRSDLPYFRPSQSPGLSLETACPTACRGESSPQLSFHRAVKR